MAYQGRGGAPLRRARSRLEVIGLAAVLLAWLSATLLLASLLIWMA